jgi:hypothetical protein
MSAGEKISLRRHAKLLNISRSSYYIKPKGETEENLHLMGRIDKLFLKDSTLGVKGMQDQLSLSTIRSASDGYCEKLASWLFIPNLI